jgi:hypothetical protein
MSNPIPIWPFRFLKWFCPDHLCEEIEGDLIRKFEKDVKLSRERKAKRKLTWNAIRFFRAGIFLRNKFSMNQNQLPMFKNYLTYDKLPLAYFSMGWLLTNFAYRIDSTRPTFAVAGTSLLIIALFTLAHQIVKTILVEFINSLK